MNEAVAAAGYGRRSRYWLVGSGMALSTLSFLIATASTHQSRQIVVSGSIDAVVVGAIGVISATTCVGFSVWVIAGVRHVQRTVPSRMPRSLLTACCVAWATLNLSYLGSMAYRCAEAVSNPYPAPDFRFVPSR